MIFGNWLWPSSRRQLFSAASASLKIMTSAVLFERHPLERTVRWLDGLAPQVIAVKLDQVEGVQEHARVVAAIADAVEARHAVVAAAHRLAVDDAGARAQAGKGLDDQREGIGQVVTDR